MKHEITFLKAPWPLGAKVGDVVEFDQVPAWALGKCKPAAEDAEVTVTLGAASIVTNIEPDADALEAEAKAEADAARAALEAEAKGLGVEFRSNISDEKLAERIAEAKAQK
jgi:uncharacterized protein (DUF58 family)